MIAHSIHQVREIEQENLLLDEINKVLESDKKRLEVSIIDLKDSIGKTKYYLNETEQQNKLLNCIIEQKLTKNHRSHYAIILSVSAVLLVSAFLIFDHNANPNELKTGYFTYDLKGDQVYGTQKWNKPVGQPLRVHVQNIAGLQDEKIHLVKDAISSKEIIQVDDALTHKAPSGEKSTFYLGWATVLENDLHIPISFVDSTSDADITIAMIRTKNMDGYSGWTESTTKNDEILQSHITIFNANNISNRDLSTITRHEFGHALGLGHSTDPDDLMSPTITTMIPYISECDYAALVSHYKLGSNAYTCEK